MKTRLTLAAGLALIAFCAGPSSAGDAAKKKDKAAKEEARLERACAKEAAKDKRDEDRGRKHPRRENKWDELCAVPEPEAPPVLPPPILLPSPPPNLVPGAPAMLAPTP